jgi:hypothetical protein
VISMLCSNPELQRPFEPASGQPQCGLVAAATPHAADIRSQLTPQRLPRESLNLTLAWWLLRGLLGICFSCGGGLEFGTESPSFAFSFSAGLFFALRFEMPAVPNHSARKQFFWLRGERTQANKSTSFFLFILRYHLHVQTALSSFLPVPKSPKKSQKEFLFLLCLQRGSNT